MEQNNSYKRTLKTISRSTSEPEAAETISKPTTKGKNVLLSDECVDYLN